MGKLVINKSLVTAEKAEALIKICPFNAITYKNGELDITSACKMCKMCVKKGGGLVDFKEDEIKEIDKSLWRGVAVYADCTGGNIHKVTLELLGKARELASVISHPVYAVAIGCGLDECAKELLRYGADKVFVFDDAAFEDFRIEPYTAAFCSFIND